MGVKRDGRATALETAVEGLFEKVFRAASRNVETMALRGAVESIIKVSIKKRRSNASRPLPIINTVGETVTGQLLHADQNIARHAVDSYLYTRLRNSHHTVGNDIRRLKSGVNNDVVKYRFV